jgi:hypothetical protein
VAEPTLSVLISSYLKVTYLIAYLSDEDDANQGREHEGTEHGMPFLDAS